MKLKYGKEMTVVAISYKAKSLSEIAKMFDLFSTNAMSKQVGARTQKEGIRNAGEAYAWAEAARILRQTTLEKE